MKLQFEPDLDYQKQAIEAVCDLFRGQEACRTEFTVARPAPDGQLAAFYGENDLGIGNALRLTDDQLYSNLLAVQLRNGLPPSPALVSGDFTVEMETGTGKTYVYLRTIFELNRRYGFTKFIIVVPSVAIKEGVYKTLQITEEHFRSNFAGAPYDYFVYDSAKLGLVRNFATSPHIQIMVVTVGAINKRDVNNLYKDSEKTGGEKPIDLIRATRPILIVDEPQSVDGGLQGQGKKALEEMSPLCALRYSATHVDKHHMVYKLDAVDAYERQLVKQIEVASATIQGGHNKPYVRLISVGSKRGRITARVELDFDSGKSVRRAEKEVEDGESLELTTGRAVYHDCRIGEIRIQKGREFMELRTPAGEHYLRVGETYGGVDPLEIQRQMIRRAIRAHLDKELRLRSQGIKVLTLFFVDAVERYRKYDADGVQHKGEYALIFEEEYRRLAKHPDYSTLFGDVDLRYAAEDVHNGYFSVDRRRVGTKMVEVYKDTRGDGKADEDAYSLIMRDKERLLSLETPLKFIFSHSALREGWDNPNVFQICALREMGSERERRQSIGRGLRLCVNQQGERQRGFAINTLTVIATESMEQFAEKLQAEIEAETGIRFGVVEAHQFAGIAVAGVGTSDGSSLAPLGFERSDALWKYLVRQGYLAADGKVLDSLRRALRDDSLAVPSDYANQLPQVKAILRKAAGKLDIKDADDAIQVKPRQAVLESAEFKALWDRVKDRTTYRVRFDNASLIDECVKGLQAAPPVSRTRLQWRVADITIGQSGVATKDVETSAPITLDEGDIELPDLLTELQDRTQLTRRSLVRILLDSGRLPDFRRNPQEFIDLAADALNRAKRQKIVDGIKYQRLGGDEYYAQELFVEDELRAYIKNTLAVRKSVHEQLVYQSDTERRFAEAMELNPNVKVYAKLPSWFRIPTPLGSYTPDWAVLIDTDEGERLYFVVETKGALFAESLRPVEEAKIQCGKAHFAALAVGPDSARYTVSSAFEGFLSTIPA